MVEDLSNHRYLALRVRLGGHPRTHHSYFVNLQTEGPITPDLWQHRLYFGRTDGGWEKLYVSWSVDAVLSYNGVAQIPLENFVLTNAGEPSGHQMTMCREKVRSVGISLLGGNSDGHGRYELGIDYISAVNEDVIVR
jgi:NADH dehydrogenase [ubiquinone] 1 alpha subcomplex assembly factor 1